MSTSEPREEGFSLVEIVVALALLAVVLVASLPMFLSALRSTIVTKQETQAKGLSQERIEQLRNLRFHIAAQNGPYLDLLDVYYTDARTTGVRPPLTVGGDTLTGAFVSTGGGTGLEPAAPYYRVGIGALSGAPGFSQVVTAQFLEADARTVLPAARFPAYDSQAVGADAPPTLAVRMSVITRWTDGNGRPKATRTTTLLTDTRPQLAAVQSQARAVAVEVASTAADGTNLVLQGAVASVDGAQSSGSSVSGHAAGSVARRTGQSDVEGATARFQLPTTGVTTSGTTSAHAPSPCGWGAFGRTSLDNVTGDVSSGLPRAPANVDSGAGNVLSARLDDSASNTCGVLSFTNVVDTGLARTDAVGLLAGSSPLVLLRDGPVSGTAVSGSAYVTTNSLTATPQRTRSGVRSTMARPLVLFPSSPDNPTTAGNPDGGLVTAQVTTARVDCASDAPGAVSAAYTLVLRWWGSVAGAPAQWHQATYTYDSTAPTPLTVTGATWNPSTVLLSGGTRLDELVTGGPPVAATVGAQSGQRGFPTGILTLTTASTLTNEAQPGYSSIKVQLGQLTCVADDAR